MEGGWSTKNSSSDLVYNFAYMWYNGIFDQNIAIRLESQYFRKKKMIFFLKAKAVPKILFSCYICLK